MNDLLELGGMVEESFEGEGKGAKGKEECVGGDLGVRDKRLGGRDGDGGGRGGCEARWDM